MQCLNRGEGIKHALSVEIWVILKMIVLGIQVLRVGNQAMLQEFVLDAGRVTTGPETVNLRHSGPFSVRKQEEGPASAPKTLTASSLWGHEAAAQPRKSVF